MSNTDRKESGYGFYYRGVEKDKFITFLKAHKSSFCKTPKENDWFYGITNDKTIEDMEDIDNLLWNYFDDFCGLGCGSLAAVANIMHRETGISFSAMQGNSNCGTKEAIMFSYSAPWNYNETEKNLTPTELNAICKKYLKELDIEDEVCCNLVFDCY